MAVAKTKLVVSEAGKLSKRGERYSELWWLGLGGGPLTGVAGNGGVEWQYSVETKNFQDRYKL